MWGIINRALNIFKSQGPTVEVQRHDTNEEVIEALQEMNQGQSKKFYPLFNETADVYLLAAQIAAQVGAIQIQYNERDGSYTITRL